MPESKKSLRATFRQVRFSLTDSDVKSRSRLICERLASWSVFRQAETVAFYLPVHNEVDLTPLLSWEARGERIPRHAVSERSVIGVYPASKKWFLPVVESETGVMSFVTYALGDALRTARFGLREPCRREAVVTKQKSAGQLSLVLLPLLAFDRAGGRLGYGGGYYDRFFSIQRSSRSTATVKPPLLIGVAYECQESVETLPVSEHDVPLDGVVTEAGVLLMGNRHL
ncbi:MAG: 5-formyltetrahydrofolate cyclo-ligase [Magnetococcales bacterium]|nr:5-formyltetrahydrofolate cyclo-ligase [Magnetococcales bacterium]